MSNELSQDLPLPDHLKLKIKAVHEALDIDTHKLCPTMKVSNLLR